MLSFGDSRRFPEGYPEPCPTKDRSKNRDFDPKYDG